MYVNKIVNFMRTKLFNCYEQIFLLFTKQRNYFSKATHFFVVNFVYINLLLQN